MRLFTGRLGMAWNRANWDPTLLAPTALLDARYGVTAKVPIAVASSTASRFGKGTPSGLDSLTAFTIAMMGQVGTHANRTPILARYDFNVSANRQFMLFTNGSGDKLRFSVHSTTTSASAVTSANFAFDTTQFIAGRWDGSNVKLRVDTTDATPVALTGTMQTPAAANAITAFSAWRDGSYSSNSGDYCAGGAKSRWIAAWSRALSDAELTTLYNGGAQITWDDIDASLRTGCIMWWEYSTTSSGFVDRSGSSNGPDSAVNITFEQGALDAVSRARSGLVSTETDSAGVTLVQATAANQPLWVPNSGQPYYQSADATDHLRQGSDGVGDYERTSAFSGMATVYLTSAAAEASIMSKFDTVGWSFGIDSSGRLELILRNTATTNEIRVRANSALGTGAWKDVGFSYDGSSSAAGVKLYQAGVAVAMTTVVDNLSATINNSVGFQLFGRNGANSAIVGRIADAPLVSRKLEAADFARHYRWAKRRNPSFSL